MLDQARGSELMYIHTYGLVARKHGQVVHIFSAVLKHFVLKRISMNLRTGGKMDQKRTL